MDTDFIRKVRSTIERRGLLPLPSEASFADAKDGVASGCPGGAKDGGCQLDTDMDTACNAPKLIVALSGGPDSVALLIALQSIGYRCVAAHCNFHLRDDESDRDEAFCRQLCQRMGVELEVTHFDVPTYERAHGVSTEMAARELRYGWFDALMERHGAVAVAVGHHRDDSVETFWLNALRGTGVTGLGGIRARRGAIVRPLIDVTRADIMAFLQQHGEEWVTDHTNLESEYRRNRIRNCVMPTVRQCFEGADERLAATVDHLREVADFLADTVDALRSRYIAADGSIAVDALAADHPRHCRFLLFEMLKERGVSRTTIDDIFDSSRSGAGFQIGKEQFIMHRGVLLKADAADSEQQTPDGVLRQGLLSELPFAVTIYPAEQFRSRLAQADKWTLFLDADSAVVETAVFTLRTWRPGDRLAPFGMKGTRLLSDIFSDLHLSIPQKRRVKVLALGERIVWVVGIRASRHFAVTPSTRRFAEISLTPRQAPSSI